MATYCVLDNNNAASEISAVGISCVDLNFIHPGVIVSMPEFLDFFRQLFVAKFPVIFHQSPFMYSNTNVNKLTGFYSVTRQN